MDWLLKMNWNQEYKKNIEGIERTLSKLRQETSLETHITKEELKGFYFGPVGEA